MKNKIFYAAVLLTAIAVFSCKEKPVVAEQNEYITRDGVTQSIADVAYTRGGDSYGIFISPKKAAGMGIYESYEWLYVEISINMLGEELDMAIGGLDNDLYVEYHRGFYQESYEGDTTRPGKIKVSKGDGNYFEVELTGYELLDGTSLSCRLARNIGTEIEEFEEPYFTGETDFGFGGMTFTDAYFIPWYEGKGAGNYYKNHIIFGVINEAGDWFSFYFEVSTTAKYLTTGTYSFSGNPGDKKFTDESYCAYEKDEGETYEEYDFTGGSIDLEISNNCFKIKINDDLTLDDPGVTVPTATFIFDYTDIFTRSGLSRSLPGQGVVRYAVSAERGNLKTRGNVR